MKVISSNILFVLVVSLFLYVGCESSLHPEKENTDEKIEENMSSSSNSDRVNVKALEGKLKAGANAVKVAIQNSDFRNELYRLLNFYSEQENRFDAVSFAELESTKAIHQNNSSYQSNIPSNKVSDVIKEAFQKAESNSQGKGKSPRKFLVEDLANIYMPNLSMWEGKEVPTITWHPLDDEEASNTGYEPRFDSEKSKVTGWKNVIVDAEYGEDKPVLMVMPGKSFSYAPAEIEAEVNSSGEVELYYVEPCEDCGGGGGGGGGSGGDDEQKKTTSYYPACVDGNCDGPMEVQIGWVELNHYPCGWFCSGRRIYFSHQEAYQNLESSPVTVETKRASVYMNSGDRGSWVKYYTQFDSDWPQYQLSKKMKIYIGRGGGYDSIVKGTYKFLKDPDAGLEEAVEIGYQTYLDLTAKDLNRDIFFDGILSRETYVSSNTSSFGHGTKEGYRVYRVDNQDGSHIRYTLPHKIY